MIILLFFVCGLAIGGGASVAWWSLDTLMGVQTITADKAVALVGLSAVGTAVFVGVMMAIEEFGWRRHDDRAPIRGSIPRTRLTIPIPTGAKPPPPPARDD